MDKPIRILAIEDDEFIRIFLKDIFWIHGIKDGYQFRMVDNIKSAEELVADRETRPDLIFLDLMLPPCLGGTINREAGFHFLEKLKSNPDTGDIKVIIFSAYRDRELQDRALKLGADKFLLKGEQLPQDLITVSREVLKI